MWRLSDLRYDDGIEADEVLLFDRGEAGRRVHKDEAIHTATSRSEHLIQCWPTSGGEDTPTCIIATLALPPTWEDTGESAPQTTDLDPALWCEASCGERDVLIAEGGHTFRGRMSAWCPHREIGYRVSLSEMGEMSTEAEYFVKGFLAGNEPGPPTADEDDAAYEADLTAWRQATARFRRTGTWFGRWGTCEVCGRVLLPDSTGPRCADHPEPH